MLLAEAADPHAQDWVNRRVEQLEFLDTRAVRWQVSVDFVLPENAPLINVGGRKFRLVPLTSWEKSDLVAFDGLAVTATTWVRKTAAGTPDSELDGGGLRIPAADGYHYGDDNPWGPEERAALVAELRRVELALIRRPPAEDSSTSAEDETPAS
jgi:hypothetical protein